MFPAQLRRRNRMHLHRSSFRAWTFLLVAGLVWLAPALLAQSPPPTKSPDSPPPAPAPTEPPPPPPPPPPDKDSWSTVAKGDNGNTVINMGDNLAQLPASDLP